MAENKKSRKKTTRQRNSGSVIHFLKTGCLAGEYPGLLCFSFLPSKENCILSLRI